MDDHQPDPTILERIATRRIEIRDHHGKLRAILGPTNDGGIALRIFDRTGSERIALGDLLGGPTVSFASGGDTIAELGVIEDPDHPDDPQPTLNLLDASGTIMAQLPATPDNT